MGINTEKDTCERSVTFSNVENSTEILKAVMLINFFSVKTYIVFESFTDPLAIPLSVNTMLVSGKNLDREYALRNHLKTIINVISR